MKGKKVVVGVFSYLDDIISAISEIKTKELEFKVYAPTFVHELDEAIDTKRSKVSLFTLIGGLTGLTFGFGLAIWCGLDYPLRVSAKNIVSIPSYVVIGYECTILFGAIATLLGVFHFCRLPWIFRQPGYDPRFSDDKFGLVVGCDGDKSGELRELFESKGAEEVKVEDGL